MSEHQTTAEVGNLARHLRVRLFMSGEQDWDTMRWPTVSTANCSMTLDAALSELITHVGRESTPATS